MAEQRKKNEDALLLALACGATVEAASKQCGLSDRTIYRRLRDADFKARLQGVRSDMIGRSAGLLTAAASEAVRTLLSLQKDSAPPAVRLGAARAVLEVGMKLREVVDLQVRIEELEAVLEELKTRQPHNAWN
jgi:hypothetical protein